MKNYESLADAIADLKSRGYKANFETQTFCLYCGDLDMRLDTDEFTIDETYRFKGDFSPEDDVVLLAISSPNGVKGILLDGYGSYIEKMNLKSGKLQNYHMV